MYGIFVQNVWREKLKSRLLFCVVLCSSFVIVAIMLLSRIMYATEQPDLIFEIQ